MLKKLNNKGITLIALVITIIVLLILAGISISMLSGDNSILSKAIEAKEKAEMTGTIEQIKIAVTSAISNGKGQLNEENLKSELKKNINGLTDNDITGSKRFGWQVKVGDKKYAISATGETNEAYWEEVKDANGNVIEIRRVDGTVSGLKIGDTIDYDPILGLDTSNEKVIKAQMPAEETGFSAISTQTFDVTKYTGEGCTWQLLGVEKGNLIIISSKQFGCDETNNATFVLNGKIGYQKLEKALNKVCSIYGKGKYALNARSVNVEDINKITGYNPNAVGVRNSTETGTKYKQGDISEYGREISYSWSNTENIPQYTYSGSNENMERSHENGFHWFDGEIWQKTEYDAGKKICSLKSDYYTYYAKTLTESYSDSPVGIEVDSPEYKMLFDSKGGIEDGYYWLASRSIETRTNYVVFWGYGVKNDKISGSNFVISDGNEGMFNSAVRPVVTLKPNIKLSQDGENAWNIVE